MQASHRARERDRLYPGRRGHAPQISISDDSHHVTEAIGGMYGDEDEYTPPQTRQGRPLSFVPSPLGDTIQPKNAYGEVDRSMPLRPPMLRTPSNEKRGFILQDHEPTGSPDSYHGSHKSGMGMGMGSNGSRSGSINGGSGPSSPSLNRTPSEAAQQHFAMTDLDSSAAVAQELSNLQAIRRMSMDVHSADPDLPSFNSGWQVPTVAPSHDADEEDPSRLFWVPASVHPELAPKAFETFIQDRVKTIKRSSLSAESSLSPTSTEGGSLRRKKSMLSRQVNDPVGYQDGAERLERKRESVPGSDNKGMVSLQELEDLAQDPSSLVRRLSIDGSRSSLEAADDTILAPKPPGQTLKRSTHTTYRRGSQRKGHAIRNRRGLPRGQDAEHEEHPMPSIPGQGDVPQLPDLGNIGKFEEFGSLQRVQTEPTPKPRAIENFSRPGRKAQTPPLQPGEFGGSEYPTDGGPVSPEDRQKSPSPESHMYPPRGSSTAKSPPPQMLVPTIVETPPPAHEYCRPQSSPELQRPDRHSSMDQPPSQPPQAPLPHRPGPQRPGLTRPGSLQQARADSQSKTMTQATVNTTPIPQNNLRTDSLSIIPTYVEEKKPDKNDKKSKDKTGGRKTSWNIFSSNDDKEKEKEAAKKSKQKLQRPAEKGHDNTRLDVLQASIDGGKGRESLVLDRSTIQVEQPKHTARKPSNEGKKEKDTGLFSSLFGGSKKKGDKESGSKKSASSLRGLSPEPPQRRLQPDIDYNWSRFSILEERAIYRMAHIKLANPRRELYSQVLLSNFMYSYLAKVQQMHPQIQIPQSAAQKSQARKEAKREQAARESQQNAQNSGTPEEYQQYQRYQEQQSRHDGPPSGSNGAQSGPSQTEQGYGNNPNGNAYYNASSSSNPPSSGQQHWEYGAAEQERVSKNGGSMW